MDSEDFKTLGECDFGTIWEVQSENRIVVNAYQAALYFSREDFFHFAKMVEDAVTTMASRHGIPKAPAPPKKEIAQITDMRSFRKNRIETTDNNEPDDFIG